MRRRLSNAVCLLSLVLAVAVAALWVRSVWWASDQYADFYGRRGVVIESHRGGFWLMGMDGLPNTAVVGYNSEPPSSSGIWCPSVSYDQEIVYGWTVSVRIPYWLPVAVLLLPSALVGLR